MNTKLNQTFYPLTPTVAKKLREAKLTAAEWRFWIYLIEHDPWGDRYVEIDPLNIQSECRMSKPTYYRAKAKFQGLGLFDFQEEKVHFRNLTGVSKMRLESQKFNKSLKNETGVSKMRLNSQKRENQLPEPSQDNTSVTSQIIQTYSDLIKTLSEEEREKFRNFCERKTRQYNKPVVLLDRWIAKNFEELYGEYQKVYGQQSSAAVTPSTKIHPAIAAGLKDGSILEYDERYKLLKLPNISLWVEEAKFLADLEQEAEFQAALEEEVEEMKA